MPSEQIFIKNKAIPETHKSIPSMKEGVMRLIKDMQSGRESHGFTRLEVTETFEIDGNQYKKTAVYKSPSMIGEVLEFDNKSEEHFRITPEIFTPLKHIQLVALSIEQSELGPDERTRIYLVKGV